MKNLFLTLAFVFTTGTVMNASVTEKEALLLDCAQDAWDFGTKYGGGDSRLEYILTDAYYDHFC